MTTKRQTSRAATQLSPCGDHDYTIDGPHFPPAEQWLHACDMEEHAVRMHRSGDDPRLRILLGGYAVPPEFAEIRVSKRRSLRCSVDVEDLGGWAEDEHGNEVREYECYAIVPCADLRRALGA